MIYRILNYKFDKIVIFCNKSFRAIPANIDVYIIYVMWPDMQRKLLENIILLGIY